MKKIAIAIALIVLASPIHAKILRTRHYFGENHSRTDSKQSASIVVDLMQGAPADKISNFDVTAACRALAVEPDAIPDDRQTRGVQHCVDDERTAREQLVTRWTNRPIEPCVSAGPVRARSTLSTQS